MTRLWIAVLLLACSCAHRPIFAQDQVDALVRQCGLEGKVEFRWVGGGKLTLTRLDTDADYDEFMCVSRDLEARGMKLGFVGREQLR